MQTSTKSSSTSSSVILDTVDDYLSPSQACINPLFQPPPANDNGDDKTNDIKKVEKKAEPDKPAVIVPRRKRRITRPKLSTEDDKPSSSILDDFVINNPKPKKKQDPIQASMADCLACSGCVTTAETVLLEQEHSLTKLRERLQQKSNRRMLTLSPASWADMLRLWDRSSSITQTNQQRKFATLLHQVLQIDAVIDGNVPLQWSRHQAAIEFCNQFRRQRPAATKPQAPYPSIAVHSHQALVYDGINPNGTSVDPTQLPPSQQMPQISSSCPAVVCLVEKSMSQLVPNLNATKSPMSMMGGMLIANKQTAVEHWAVMPCHDKKLEASRKDFLQKSESVIKKEVELVITTNECLQMLTEWVQEQEGGQDVIMDTAEPSDDTKFSKLFEYLESLQLADVLVDHKELLQDNFVAPKLLTIVAIPQHEHNDGMEIDDAPQPYFPYASGGHADFIFRYACQELFGYAVQADEQMWISGSAAAPLADAPMIKSARLANRRKRSQDYFTATLIQDTTTGEYSIATSSTVASSNMKTVLQFAIANGMQTLQRILSPLQQQQQQGEAPVHFIEAMACPSGCVNGGGQVRKSSGTQRETPTQTRERVAATGSKLKTVGANTNMPSPSVLQEHPELTKTSYHVVPPMQYAMGAAAGVAVQDMVW